LHSASRAASSWYDMAVFFLIDGQVTRLIGFSGRRWPVTGCGIVTHTNPDDCRVTAPGVSINLVATDRGDFKVHLTWVELRRLRLIRCRENVSCIAVVTLAPQWVFVAFPTQYDPPPVWNGVKLRPGRIVLHGLGERTHQRIRGKAGWALISLPTDDLVAYGRALSGVDLTAPVSTRIIHPPTMATAQLRSLLGKVCRLAETKPDMIAHREVARSLEQDLLHALINCLTAEGVREEETAPSTRHADIMVRFEDVLASHDDRQLSMAELTAAIGVSERTLRVCCTEFLGMSPGSYVRLRRLNLVRAALWRADPATTSVAAVARRYGFSELGRFAGTYRTEFGEVPSITLGGHSKIRDASLPDSHRRQPRISRNLTPKPTVT
jgi:AraC-like DNA-binding protein